MKKYFVIFLSICGIILYNNCTAVAAWPENRHRLGGGVHYWASIEDIIIAEADDDGLAFMLSYQYQLVKFFTVEADIEVMGKGYAGAPKSVVAPQVYALIGRGLYGGIGVGINYLDGEWADNPFFAFRAGVDLEIFPSFYLDLNANYRSDKWNFGNLDKDVQLKTITLGAILRFEF